jgi:hypothetical protein
VARSVYPEPIPLDVLYEDPDLLVINKPPGMVVQFAQGSVERAVVAHLDRGAARGGGGGGPRWGTPSWPWNSARSFEGIVHRLDKGTSGALALAKHPRAARALRAAFAEQRVRKTYLAVAVGRPSSAARTAAAAATTTKTGVSGAAVTDDETAGGSAARSASPASVARRPDESEEVAPWQKEIAPQMPEAPEEEFALQTPRESSAPHRLGAVQSPATEEQAVTWHEFRAAPPVKGGPSAAVVLGRVGERDHEGEDGGVAVRLEARLPTQAKPLPVARRAGVVLYAEGLAQPQRPRIDAVNVTEGAEQPRQARRQHVVQPRQRVAQLSIDGGVLLVPVRLPVDRIAAQVSERRLARGRRQQATPDGHSF